MKGAVKEKVGKLANNPAKAAPRRPASHGPPAAQRAGDLPIGA